MRKNYKFDYDEKNDSFFIYDPKIKSKASITIGDLVVDFGVKKTFSAIEFFNASSLFQTIFNFKGNVKKKLSEITKCQLEVIPNKNMLIIKIHLEFEKTSAKTSFTIPMIGKTPSAALA